MRTVAVALAIAAFGLVSPLGAVSSPRVGSGGVTVGLPSGWDSLRIGPPPTTGVVEPLTRLVVASAPIRFGRGCNQVDYSFSSRAVAIVVLEWIRPTPGARWTPRPARFTSRMLPVRPAMVECFGGSGGSAEFADHGRRFAAFVLLGRQAPQTLAARARALLDTLRVTSR